MADLPPAPDGVQKWLRQEDWEALTKAWSDAEAQAIAWAEGSDNEEQRMEELWQEANNSASFQASPSQGSLPPLSQTSSKMGRTKTKKIPWNEGSNSFGFVPDDDHRKPMPLRRYFDPIPGENTIPRHYRGDGKPQGKLSGKKCEMPLNLQSRRSWVENWEQCVSPDNEGLHPHLRTYFDRRGLESCYRQRPTVDATTKKMRPRTPQRPTTREKILRFRSLSEPSLQESSTMSGAGTEEPEVEIGTAGRHTGGMNWGTRCQTYGTADFKVTKPKVNGVRQPPTHKMPWVNDFAVTVNSDNEILNPLLRHYFDADGLEASYRNRGMHYGRPPRSVFGLFPGQKPRKPSMDSGSSWDSVRSSLLDQLSYSSLLDTPTGGLPGVRRLDAVNLGTLGASASAPNLGGTGSVRSGSLGGGSAYLDNDGWQDFEDGVVRDVSGRSMS